MHLMVDPYAYPDYARADLRTMNQVGDAIAREFDVDEEKLVPALRAAHKPGMAPAALRTHVLRGLGILK